MLKQLGHINIVIVAVLLFFACAGEEVNPDKSFEDLRAPAVTSGTKVLKELFFVGKYGERAGIYKYDFTTNRYKIFWGTFRETVIKLSYSDDLEHLFFLTAERIGTNRGVSSIKNVKLYKIDLVKLSTELVSEIGDAVQLYADWSDNNYIIQFTSFDLKYTTYINKYDQVYSQFGKLLKENKQTFDFINDSYPNFDIPGNSLISPSGNFAVKPLPNTLQLNVAGSNQKIFIDSTKKTASRVGWSDEESFVFIRLKNEQQSNESSAIYIFDIINRNVTQKFYSEGTMNFFITKDLLIYDSNIKGKSTIQIFNYRKNEFVNSINLSGGCGLWYLADY